MQPAIAYLGSPFLCLSFPALALSVSLSSLLLSHKSDFIEYKMETRSTLAQIMPETCPFSLAKRAYGFIKEKKWLRRKPAQSDNQLVMLQGTVCILQ